MLDGRTINKNINFRKYKIKHSSKSSWQNEVGAVLASIFKNYVILEEFSIGNKLKIDFLIPLIRVAIECDGVQHSKFNKFFHGDITGFKRQKVNDKKKDEWARLNDFLLIRIKYPIKDKQDVINVIKKALE